MEDTRGPRRTQYAYRSKASAKVVHKKVDFSRLPAPAVGPMDGFSSVKYNKKVQIRVEHVDIDVEPPATVRAKTKYIPVVYETLDMDLLEAGKYNKDVMREALMLRGILLPKTALKDEYIKVALENGVGIQNTSK